MKNINEIMLNPVRMRIVQLLSIKDSMTATELCNKISDVPRTTLYRHIKILIDYSIINIVSENKIRGSLERTLSLNKSEIAKYNTTENATQNTFAFLMEKYSKFEKYFNSKDADPAKDTIFLNSSILMMNDKEFNSFLGELKDLLLKYNFEYQDGRKARDISIISAPEDKDEK